MMLFKAKQAAQKEFDEALTQKGVTLEQLREGKTGRSSITNPLKITGYTVACKRYLG